MNVYERQFLWHSKSLQYSSEYPDTKSGIKTKFGVWIENFLIWMWHFPKIKSRLMLYKYQSLNGNSLLQTAQIYLLILLWRGSKIFYCMQSWLWPVWCPRQEFSWCPLYHNHFHHQSSYTHTDTAQLCVSEIFFILETTTTTTKKKQKRDPHLIHLLLIHVQLIINESLVMIVINWQEVMTKMWNEFKLIFISHCTR